MERNDVDAINEGKLFAFFHACVEYVDTFDARHVTKTAFLFPIVRPGVDNYRRTPAQRWGPREYIEST
jgi:hypothetical protein